MYQMLERRLLWLLVSLYGTVAQDLFLAARDDLKPTLVASNVDSTLIAGAKGGTSCIACGLVVTLAIENSDALDRLSHLLVARCGHSHLCRIAVDHLVAFAQKKLSPDAICSGIDLCDASCKLFAKAGEWPVPVPRAPHQDPPNVHASLFIAQSPIFPQEEARLLRDAFVAAGFDAPRQAPDDFFGLSGVLASLLSFLAGGPALNMSANVQTAAAEAASEAALGHPCKLNPKCIVKRFTDDHLPIFDADADAFALSKRRGLRGSHWRGADCDDRRPDVYPGRRVLDPDTRADHDCNGITGGNSSGTFEDLFCAGTDRRGLVHLGDSATAHFHAPPQWLTINRAGWNLNNFVPDVEDELDQVACAWGTGYRQPKQCPWSPGKGGMSLAERLRARNRCNHRDFQNIGVNGARSSHWQDLVGSAARNQSLDHPALVVYSLIGNDVCNGHPGTSHMTPPDEFKSNTLKALSALDQKLPPKSAVLLIGLVDGRVLYDTMHAMQHPIGATYDDVYGYLNCNEKSPCLGWLNSNATLRNVSTAWANSLNAQYEAIMAAGHIYENFQLGYYNPDWRKIIHEYVAQGGVATDMFEHTDGFHPSQLGNTILAATIWEYLEEHFPAAIGDVNPHNAEIEALFGDQGGY